mmetsp:Transcript_22935/g.55532  ORF Transcript_22935/g.55532 Transcript_22935/m.55532 type:complete len:207 (-) Transcript_22935:1231-1851(-)
MRQNTIRIFPSQCHLLVAKSTRAASGAHCFDGQECSGRPHFPPGICGSKIIQSTNACCDQHRPKVLLRQIPVSNGIQGHFIHGIKLQVRPGSLTNHQISKPIPSFSVRPVQPSFVLLELCLQVLLLLPLFLQLFQLHCPNQRQRSFFIVLYLALVLIGLHLFNLATRRQCLSFLKQGLHCGGHVETVRHQRTLRLVLIKTKSQHLL